MTHEEWELLREILKELRETNSLLKDLVEVLRGESEENTKTTLNEEV